MGIVNDLLDTGPAKFLAGSKLTGTASSVTTAVTGATSAFNTEVAVGDYVYDPISRGIKKVTAVASATSLTIESAFNTALSAGSTLYVLKDIGDTKGGIEVEWATETYTKETDRRGKVGRVISDREAKITVPLSDWKPDNFRQALPDAMAKVVGSGKTLSRFSKSIGFDLTTLGAPAAVIPVINGAETTDPNRIWVFHNVYPTEETVSVNYAPTEQRPIRASFYCADLGDGEIGYVGDNTIRP